MYVYIYIYIYIYIQYYLYILYIINIYNTYKLFLNQCHTILYLRITCRKFKCYILIKMCSKTITYIRKTVGNTQWYSNHCEPTQREILKGQKIELSNVNVIFVSFQGYSDIREPFCMSKLTKPSFSIKLYLDELFM